MNAFAIRNQQTKQLIRISTFSNARLIAAAPELLAALGAAVAYLEANSPKGKIRDIFTQLNQYENDVMKPSRAALAKATATHQTTLDH